MNNEERIEYHMKNYGLNREQFLQADALMSGPISNWPPRLHEMVHEAGQRYGSSGDVFWECIVVFVKGQTLDEYLAADGAGDSGEGQHT